MARPLITLTTDFGLADPFVGTMKGVILHIQPDVSLVDLTHDIPPQDVRSGAYAIGSAYRYFPPDAIHVAVVDPGVGTRRWPVAVRTGHATFVCPDNGLLSYVLADAGAYVEREAFSAGRVAVPEGWEAYHLTNEDYWLHPLSATFHGRDLFAPVTGHLASGVPLSALGSKVVDLAAFALPQPSHLPGMVIGQVVHIDRFGNLITNLRRTHLPGPTLTIDIAARTIPGLSPTYQAGTDLVALIGSSGTLEIAVPNGNAAGTLGARLGMDVRVKGAP